MFLFFSISWDFYSSGSVSSSYFTLSVLWVLILVFLTSSILHPLYLSPSVDGFQLLRWWGWWPSWRLGCLVSRAIRADVVQRERSELSASASPRVTFHGQLVSEHRRSCRLSALFIVKINGNQSPHSTLLSPLFKSLPPTLTLSYPCLSLLQLYLSEFSPVVLLQLSANGCCLAICYPTVQFPLHQKLFYFFYHFGMSKNHQQEFLLSL